MSPDKPGGGSLLDDVLMKDGAEADDGDYGLELDAAQAQEVRQIFFTTLPQYLEPIEQMVDQLFGADEVAEDLRATLVTTVSSIAAAAARIGIENALEPLKRMRDEISQLVDHVGAPPAAVREAVLRELSALRELSSDSSGGTAPRGLTIVAAFKHVQGIDRSVLEKLTAAGVVTVDQIEMAEPREIAAVTGLAMEMVTRLIAALAEARAVVDGSSASAEPAAPDDPLEEELNARLRACVDAEAALQEAQARLSRFRASKIALQRELSAALDRRDAVRAQLEAARAQLGVRLGEMAKLHASRAAADRERANAEDALQRTRAHLAKLSHEQRAARDAYVHCSDELSNLTARVRRLLAATRREDGERAEPARARPPHHDPET